MKKAFELAAKAAKLFNENYKIGNAVEYFEKKNADPTIGIITEAAAPKASFDDNGYKIYVQFSINLIYANFTHEIKGNIFNVKHCPELEKQFLELQQAALK